MDDGTRRDLLRAVGLGSALGLAGCQGNGSPTDSTTGSATPGSTADESLTTTEATTAEETTARPASITVEVSIGQQDDARIFGVTGEVTSPSGIESIVVTTDGDSVRDDAGGAARYTVDAELSVEGGRAYDIEVRAVETDGSEVKETVETGYVPTAIDAMQADRLVGAHYYPWFEMSSGHQNWTDDVPAVPVLGEYASDTPNVIDQHLNWCLEHGIRWLSIAWWGPESGSDEALKNEIVEADRFEDVEFSILYETAGRLGEFSYDLDGSAARDRLRDDLSYLEETYFRRENYLHMDGRPVVFFYIAGALRGDVEAAFAEASRGLAVEPYVLADVPFGTPPSTHPVARAADAVTTYNPYSPRSDIEEVFHDLYERGNEILHLGAEAADVAFVPTVIPGFDDTEIPDAQREDNPVLSASPERYERVIEQVSPHLGDAEAVLVTSFNEWYENTQIEPSEAHGSAYLELTADRLATGTVSGFDPSGVTMRLAFDETVIPAEHEAGSTDTRELAFMAGGLELYDGDEKRVAYDIGTPEDEPSFLEGAYGPGSASDRTWRWFGGHSAETTIYVDYDASAVDSAVLYGQPMLSNEIEADVFFDGAKTDHVAFGNRTGSFDEYRLSLTLDGA